MTQAMTVFGFGPLGEALARQLLAKGYRVNLWNRSPEKLLSLAEAGAIVKSSAAAAIKSAEIIVCALPDPNAIQETLFDVDWAHELHGRLVINFGSMSLSRSQALMDAFHAHQADYVEVAGLGSVADMTAGHLHMLVGAEQSDYERVRSLLDDLSNRVTHVGEVGVAAAIKLALHQMSATLFCAFSASVGLIREQGLEVDQFMDFLRASPWYTPMFDQKLPRMLSRDYSGATLAGKHLERELKLFLEEAEDLGINAHHVQSIHELINLCVARGMRDLDFTAVNDVIDPPREEDG